MNYDDKLLSTPPKNWTYSKRPFNRKFDAIWLTSTSDWVYTTDPVECIWGFVNVKTNKVRAPINAKKPGDEVSWTNHSIHFHADYLSAKNTTSVHLGFLLIWRF